MQPVEAIFNRLIQKADIQRARVVGFTNVLMVYAFGRFYISNLTLDPHY